jgi:polyvinyl alcohol dehydrogenase (cytochrome)
MSNQLSWTTIITRPIAIVMMALALESTLTIAQPSPSSAPAVDGRAIFQLRCKSCHEPPVERAPTRAELASRPPEELVRVLSRGVMAPMTVGMAETEIQAVTAYLTSAPVSPDGEKTPEQIGLPTDRARLPQTDNRCAVNLSIQAGSSNVTSFANDLESSRFQLKPGFSLTDLPRLRLKWAFSMDGGGQPVVVGNWLFTTNRDGTFYALDSRTGCVHWAAEGVGSRTTPRVIRSSIAPSGWLTVIGLSTPIVQAFDAYTGKSLWRSETLDTHPAAVITGSPAAFHNRLFIPISSHEEAAAMERNYRCCSFRGSVVALDLTTGRKEWQSYVIAEPQRAFRNATGQPMIGPAGAGIWSAPTIDPKRGAVYVATGNSYTDIHTQGADAIVAFDMKTGALRWRTQVTVGDNYILGCSGVVRSANCPSPVGPDYDFGAGPIVFTGADRRQVLIAGQKSGVVYGLNPLNGRVLWSSRAGNGSSLGGIEWGIGADDKRVYVPISDFRLVFAEVHHTTLQSVRPSAPAKPGLYALDPFTGSILWQTPAPIVPCHYTHGSDTPDIPCIRAESAAPAIMPGVVFSGTLDGWLRAYEADTGKILWAYSTTAQTYQTVNGVKDQPGGAIDGLGPTLANGMVFTMSGFNGSTRVGSNGVNVLLAFSVNGQ